MSPCESDNVRVVERAFDKLSKVSPDGSVSVGEICLETGLPPSMVHDILTNMDCLKPRD